MTLAKIRSYLFFAAVSLSAQVPQILLFNATVESVDSSTLDGQKPQTQGANHKSSGSSSNNNNNGRRIKLDCRVSGYPTPWIQWYKNGKLLRNSWPVSIRTSKWQKRHDVRVSRLELPVSGKGSSNSNSNSNSSFSANFECRAMNVVAHEPVVSVYTIFVGPNHYGVFSMQHPESLGVPQDQGHSSSNNSNINKMGETTAVQQPTTTTTTTTMPSVASISHSTTVQQQQTIGAQTIGAGGSGISATTQSPQSLVTVTTTTPTPTTTSTSTTTTPTPMPTMTTTQAHPKLLSSNQAPGGTQTSTTNGPTYSSSSKTNSGTQAQAQAQANSNNKSTGSQSQTTTTTPVVGQPCPREAHDSFCLNKGTCELIGQIAEYFCKCLAKNDYGSSERVIKLIVLGVPERPNQLLVRDIWSRSALIAWSPASFKHPSSHGNNNISSNQRVSNYTVQYWRKNLHQQLVSESAVKQQQQNHRREETIVDGLQSSALLVNLLPSVTYEVSVIAHNQVGHSEASDAVNVTTSEEEPSAPPTDVQVETRGSSTLRVSWKVPPFESLNGKLIGFYIGYRARYSPPTFVSIITNTHAHNNQQLLVSPQISFSNSNPKQQQQQQQQQQQSAIFSFKTVDAIEGQLYYDTFLTNLKHNQDYEVTVRAFNKAGSGPDCHILMARTSSTKLPQAPQLQVQRITSNSVTLRLISTVMIDSPRSGNIPMVPLSQLASNMQQNAGMVLHNSALEIPRYILYYQLQGEREWYELTVQAHDNGGGGGSFLFPEGGATSSFNHLQQGGMQTKPNLIEMIGTAATTSEHSTVTSQSSVHTLSNLQPGSSYRIYAAAANDYGIGDPSNVVSIKTDSLVNQSGTGTSGLSKHESAYLAGGSAASFLLDGQNPNQAHFSNWLWWDKQQLWTILSSIALFGMLVTLLVAYFVWQNKLKQHNKGGFNSSTGSSNPSSWTQAAASDTIQSEYSVKRFPTAAVQGAQGTISAGTTTNHHQLIQQQHQVLMRGEIYDEVTCDGQTQFGSTNTHSSRQQQQRQQLIQNNNNNRLQSTGNATTMSRPVLSSNYHQPADLMSNSSSSGSILKHLQQQGLTSGGRHYFGGGKSTNIASATLNRNQNRQLPPVPYSTLSVKEIGGAGGGQSNKWQRQQQQQQEYRLCANQITVGTTGGTNHNHHQLSVKQSTGGSQTPLIYGVIE